MQAGKKTINVFNKDKLIKTFNAPIDYAEYVDEERVKEGCKLHFRGNRNHNFSKDLGFFSFDLYDEAYYLLGLDRKELNGYDEEKIKEFNEMMKKLNSEYERAWIDCYEHGTIHFSLAGQGMQCRFDTTNRAGIIAVKKDIFDKDFDFNEYFKERLSDYSDYCNGWIYEFCITEDVVFHNDEYGNRVMEEIIDESYGSTRYFSRDIEEMEEEMKSIVEGILEDRGIEFDEIKIIN